MCDRTQPYVSMDFECFPSIKSFLNFPHPITCPPESPVLCTNNVCVSNSMECPQSYVTVFSTVDS